VINSIQTEEVIEDEVAQFDENTLNIDPSLLNKHRAVNVINNEPEKEDKEPDIEMSIKNNQKEQAIISSEEQKQDLTINQF